MMDDIQLQIKRMLPKKKKKYRKRITLSKVVVEFDYGLDIEDNIILVQDEISQGMVFDCISKVRLLRKINPELKSITLLLNSPGGDVVETLALIDYIRTLKDNEDISTNIVCRGSS